MPRSVLPLVLLVLAAAPLTAQVEPGTHVRVTLRDSARTRREAVVRESSADTLFLTGTDLPAALPWVDLRRLERWNGRKGNALAGAGVGLALGAAVGGIAAAGSSCAELSPCAGSAGGVVGGGLVGALLGLAVGAAIRTDSWAEVRGTPIHVEPAAPPPGIPGIALQVRF